MNRYFLIISSHVKSVQFLCVLERIATTLNMQRSLFENCYSEMKSQSQWFNKINQSTFSYLGIWMSLMVQQKRINGRGQRRNSDTLYKYNSAQMWVALPPSLLPHCLPRLALAKGLLNNNNLRVLNHTEVINYDLVLYRRRDKWSSCSSKLWITMPKIIN